MLPEAARLAVRSLAGPIQLGPSSSDERTCPKGPRTKAVRIAELRHDRSYGTDRIVVSLLDQRRARPCLKHGKVRYYQQEVCYRPREPNYPQVINIISCKHSLIIPTIIVQIKQSKSLLVE